MKSSFYREKWASLKARNAARHEYNRLSRQIAYSFMDSYLKDYHYKSDFIDLLCEMTTDTDKPGVNIIASQALFRIIIESLCDDFEDLQTDTYNRVMSQVIDFCRKLPSGAELDHRLRTFEVYSQKDLLERINRIRTDGVTLKRQRNVKKILLLSRVTIGADVAITSVIIQRMSLFFPQAEIVLIGGSKLEEIYGGNLRFKIKKVHYDREGGLLDRLSSWQLVLKTIQEELTSCPLKNTILVDPDSRLSQLGVLPVIHHDHYCFFDSRSHKSYDSNMSMAELTNAWIDRLTGETDSHCPQVWLQTSNVQKATIFCDKLKRIGARRIIAINFGVGGNPRKKVSGLFEQNLLLSLLQKPQTVIVLDKGFGKEELIYADSLINAVKDQGFSVQNAPFSPDFKAELNWGVVGLQTRIGEIAAIIAQCDEFIGYDSACQHIAAALGTPCLTIFAGSNNLRFIRRWSAFGKNSSNIVHVDTLTDPTSIDVDDIIARIMNERRIKPHEFT